MKKNCKKLLCALLLVALSISIVACGNSEREITPEELRAEYISHGYQVTVMERGENEYGNTYTVQAVSPDGEGGYIIFEFFSTEEEAEEYYNQFKNTSGILIFSTIFGNPTVVRYKRHGKIVVSFETRSHYKIFKSFIKA